MHVVRKPFHPISDDALSIQIPETSQRARSEKGKKQKIARSDGEGSSLHKRPEEKEKGRQEEGAFGGQERDRTAYQYESQKGVFAVTWELLLSQLCTDNFARTIPHGDH
ncbi:hypothetical protein X798_04809 [Onchocerca flexuosa]|uniref:Uncharacterized protein n=2 Tax=Onchocerca flexuosa TaxID=387005 RepID=A0A183HZ14_9BILA|nr:hypothetical protein X798_04809 [Onchocerca flexuosa]VDP12008.1 unnamed protein product [Onchocerca flexuosa]